ncbi:MAG: rubrerythrin family protein [Coriobacteriia bacterium]|nr:rubrerythrin family protein [Coriobacteriia bacterium]
MDFKGSKTEANLQAAFAGESQARNKYTYYASQAKKDGFVQMGAIFEETAGNEKEHAKIWFKLLMNNGEVNGSLPPTLQNLADAAGGENFEWTEMYPGFEATAREEGFAAIAELFKMVGAIEKEHEDRYRQLIENIEGDEVFKRPRVEVWRCSNCGHLHVGESAPEVCPVCNHPKDYFELVAKNY